MPTQRRQIAVGGDNLLLTGRPGGPGQMRAIEMRQPRQPMIDTRPAERLAEPLKPSSVRKSLMPALLFHR